MPAPIPMLARPLDMVCGAPDPDERFSAPHGQGLWLMPGGRLGDIGTWALDPGDPGQPERLPWKRKLALPPQPDGCDSNLIFGGQMPQINP